MRRFIPLLHSNNNKVCTTCGSEATKEMINVFREYLDGFVFSCVFSGGAEKPFETLWKVFDRRLVKS